jgi:Protein of unknown function (DUF1592)/Protein of unknown function (DUF1588)/Protein of unknown function (DUF1587)/Protein of unknown function (DUF1595)/Protein of unknown function (DUF1585)
MITGLLAAGLLGTSACRDDAGSDDGDSSGSASDDGGSDSAEPAACLEEGMAPDSAPLRRLTHWEYDNTIRDLLGDDARRGTGFPTETSATGFDNEAAGLQVSAMLAEEYMRAAEEIATAAVADLPSLLPCDPAAIGEDACAAALVDTLGPRAYRRPLTDAQRTRLLDLYAAAKAEHGFSEAIGLVVQALLQSPWFLYRVELGMPDPEGADVVPLDDWELASRLSYLLWGSMPDDALFDAAAAGALSAPDELRAQAERMLEDPRAREAVASWGRQWLRLDDVDHLDRDPGLYPELDDELRISMKAETSAFIEHVVFDGEGDLGTLLTASYGFPDDRLAALYGVADPGSLLPTKAELPASERAGLLTQASILALTAKPDQSSPVQRGAFVRERLLCETLPEPPPGVDTTPPTVDPDLPTRQRYEQHASDPTCAACHRLIDPIGFGLEHYDAIGRFRTDDGGAPVDARGELLGLAGGDVAFEGAVELAGVLAGREELRRCFVEQWFTYAWGRAPAADDACTADELYASFDAAGQDVRALLVALTQTAAFRHRPAHQG